MKITGRLFALEADGFTPTVGGSLADKLLETNMNLGVLRPWIDDRGRTWVTVNGRNFPVANATLRHEEWLYIDKALLKITRSRLNGVADLETRGLTFNIDNGLGHTVLAYEREGDITDAVFSMDGVNRGQNDMPETDIAYLPLPIVHKDFNLNARLQAASRNTGTPLDITTGEMAARKVGEALERLLFVGTGGITYGGGTVFGYLNYPDSLSLSVTAHWDEAGATGETILTDVKNAVTALNDAHFYGPFVLYLCAHWFNALLEDFKPASDKSILARLMEHPSIEAIKPSDYITDNKGVIVQMTSDVVRLVNGMAPTTVQWDTEGGMRNHFKHLAIKVPQIRSDKDGNCGVLILG